MLYVGMLDVSHLVEVAFHQRNLHKFYCKTFLLLFVFFLYIMKLCADQEFLTCPTGRKISLEEMNLTTHTHRLTV